MSQAGPDPSEARREPVAGFPSTPWSLVLAAGSTGRADSDQALNALCRIYWPPLYAFLRRQGHSPHDAEDLVQGFIGRVLQRADLESVGPDKGRFRSFLLTSLRNYVIKQALHQKAHKRGGGRPVLSIDVQAAEALCSIDLAEASPEIAFDQQWCRTVLVLALRRLGEEQAARGKDATFAVLAPLLDGADPGDYAEAGRRLGMAEGTVAVAVHRLRARLQELIRAEVLETVGSSKEADDEVRHLLEVWRR